MTGSGRRTGRAVARAGAAFAVALSLTLLGAWTGRSAAARRAAGGPEPPAPPGLGAPSLLPAAERLFFADFDDLDAHAEQARGSPTASLERRLLPSREPGPRRTALSLAAGERCRYAAQRNVRPEQGTLSFWLRAAPAEGGRPRRFLQLQSAGPEPFVLAVDSGNEPDTLRVVVKRGRSPDRLTHSLHARALWGEAVWRRVDVSWRSDRLALYLDGALAEALRMRDFALPSLAGGELELLPGLGGEAVALDEVAIWSRALASAEIAQTFAATRAEPLPAPLVVAPRLGAPLRVDGRLEADEWAGASLMPIASDATTSFAAPRFASAQLAWDGAALRVAFASLASDEDREAFVLGIAAPDGSAAAHRFRVTPDGVSYRGPAGVAPGRLAQAHGGDVWTVEAELPLAALANAAPAAGGEWRLQLAREVDGRRVLGGAITWAAGGAERWGRLRLGEDGGAVRAVASPALAWGRPALAIEGAPGWRALLTLSPVGGDRVERGWRLAERPPAAPALPAEGAAVVAIVVRDEAGAERLAWSTRVSSRALLDVPLVPDPVGRRLGSEIRSEDFAPRWREQLAAGGLELAIRATAPDGTRSEARAPLTEGAALHEVPSSLAPGRHRVAYHFTGRDERLRFEMEREIEVPALDWAARAAGESDAVLEPWTPLRYPAPAAAEMWGRRYTLDGPLLAAARNQERALLRAPMRLELETPAGRAALVTDESAVVEQTPARGAWRGTAAFGASGVRVAWRATLEYDGLLVSSLALEPPAGGIEVRRLRLEIPLREDVVRYLRGTYRGPAIQTGRVAWNGRRWQGGFQPFLWVTNEREGFLYLSDSQANWVHPEGARVVAVNGGADAGITLDLIQGPLRLDRRVEYQLGFQATPVKPPLPDARAWNFGNFALAPGQNAMSWIVGWAVHDGVFEVADAAALATFERHWRERGMRLFYYGATSATPALGATFRLFEDVWRSATAASFPGSVAPTAFRRALPPHRTVGVCPAAGSFQDLLLHQAEALVRDHGVRGIYTDTDGVFADDNTLHGCGYEDAFGRRGPSFGIFAKRRFAKRLAAIVRQAHGGRGLWMSHDHARLVPPIHGFADFWYPGEELRGRASGRPWFYSDELDATAWRVEYRGASSGVTHVFLPELAPRADRAATEALLALAAVNDVNVGSALSDRGAVGEYWALRERLGLLDAAFVGHWEPDCPVRVEAEGAVASAYRTRGGWVLVVANPLAEPRTLPLRLDRAQLGPAPSEARDARTGKRLAVLGDALEVPLAARSYTFLQLR